MKNISRQLLYHHSLRVLMFFLALWQSQQAFGQSCIPRSVLDDNAALQRRDSTTIYDACGSKPFPHEDSKIVNHNVSGLVQYSFITFRDRVVASCPSENFEEDGQLLSQQSSMQVSKLQSAMAKGDNSFRYDRDIDNSKLSTECRMAISGVLCRYLGSKCAATGPQVLSPGNTQQNSQSQSQSQQAQRYAQQNQLGADQARAGKRKTNDLAAQAHECIAIDQAGSGNFGAFKNICGYKVNFFSCNYKPRSIQGGFNWSADFDCEKQKFGLYSSNGGRSEAAHNRNTEFVYWFACKAPATPVDATFTVGKGLEARCHN